MSKESLIDISRKLVFKETFSSEYDVLKNKGVLYNVTINNGLAISNGSNSSITYPKLNLKKKHTLRFVVTFYDDVTYHGLCGLAGDFDGVRYSPATGFNYSINGTRYGRTNDLEIGKRYDIAIVRDDDKGYIYWDGVLQNDFIISSANNVDFVINTLCAKRTTAYVLNGEMELAEFYNDVLTEEELKLLTDNKYYRKPSLPNKILDFDSSSGVLKCNRDITAHNVEIVKTGNYYGAKFNGIDSYIVTDITDSSVFHNGFTILSWVRPRKLIAPGFNRILDKADNASAEHGFYYAINSTSEKEGILGVNINSSTFKRIDVDNELISNWLFYATTINVDGYVVNYTGCINRPLLETSEEDFFINKPSEITTNYPLAIGARSQEFSRIFDGCIKSICIFDSVLDLETITNIWSESKARIL